VFDVGGEILGSGADLVSDFVLGTDKLVIVNGSAALVSFVDEGAQIGVFYDGAKIAVLAGIADIPADTAAFFGASVMA